MEPPEVRYARSGGVHIAFQVFGDRGTDLVLGLPWITHLGVEWEYPPLVEFFRDLSRFARVILFDKRGVGLSDRAVGIPTLEERTDDIRAVMDACGSKKAALLGISESAPMCLLFAATYPERVEGLILLSAFARSLYADDYPWGVPRADYERDLAEMEASWGQREFIERTAAALAPSRKGDGEFVRWIGRMLTYGASPASAISMERMDMAIDVRETLSAIHVPTLVVRPSGDSGSGAGHSRYLCDHIEGARQVEVPGSDPLIYAAPASAIRAAESIRVFLNEPAAPPDSSRVLATILFTDIVGSTRLASSLGDRAWGELLHRYYDAARSELARFRGREVKTTGDGMVSISFDGPTRAARYACALRDRARQLGLEIRAGLHTGECVLREGDIEGLAVTIAARACEKARGGEVLASSTVRDLSVGSDLPFVDCGLRTLKGIDGRWRLYSVDPLVLGKDGSWSARPIGFPASAAVDSDGAPEPEVPSPAGSRAEEGSTPHDSDLPGSRPRRAGRS